MIPRGTLRRLLRSDDGVSAIEFGFLGPIFIALVFGTLELGYGIYADAVLKGALQQAGRNSGLESSQNDQASVDLLVTNQIKTVVPSAVLTFKRQNYQDFSDVGQPEDFVDANSDGEYDNNECFTDENGNENWDADMGNSGQGGANDVVLYTVNMKFDRFIPVAGFFGTGNKREYTARTTLRNQPFATQRTRVPTQVCP